MYLLRPRFCTAAFALVLVTACGGGGGGDGPSGGNGGGTVVVTGNGVFAQPGPFTTSDSFINVLERIENPTLFDVDRRTMPVFGFVLDSAVAYEIRPVDPNVDPEDIGTIVEGRLSYDNISAELRLESDQIRFIDPTNSSRDRVYRLVTTSSPTQVVYANPTGAFSIDRSSEGVVGNFIPQLGYGTIMAGFDERITLPPFGGGRSSVSTRGLPYMVYGLRTTVGDAPRASIANGSPLNSVRYRGLVFAVTGPGTPVFPAIGGFKYQDQLTVGCESALDMTLDLTFGVLTTAPLSGGCIDSDGSGGRLQFAMSPITFRASTVDNNSFNRTAVSLTTTGRLVDGKVDQSNNPVTSHSVRSDKLSGAIFGVGGASIVISGSGTNGAFMVLAQKVREATP